MTNKLIEEPWCTSVAIINDADCSQQAHSNISHFEFKTPISHMKSTSAIFTVPHPVFFYLYLVFV